MLPSVTNLLSIAPGTEETFSDLLASPSFRLEQIVSNGQASAQGYWYDQPNPEWVLLLQGAATLQFENGTIQLTQGDSCLIPAHSRHRVEFTSTDAIWLALHYPSHP